MGKKTHSVEESDRTISPANARPALFDSGDRVLEALAILRAVRKPGKNKLGLQEAIAVSQEQGEAFLRYRNGNTSIRRLQVFVEGTLVMTISLDERSVNLDSFDFNVASPHDAVMQILKADEGGEPVVLRNLPLCTVGPKGLVDITPLPDGQICLQIAPPRNGRFDVRVAFAEEKNVPLLSAVDLSPSRDNALSVIGNAEKHSSRIFFPLCEPFTISSWVLGVLLICLSFTAIVTLKRHLATSRSVTKSEHNVAVQPPKKKPNIKKRSFRANAPATSLQESCCDREAVQNMPTEFSAEHADGSVSISIGEEGLTPESSDSQIAEFAPFPEPVQPVSVEKPTIKIGEKLETETKGPTYSFTDSKKVSVPLNYSKSDGRRVGAVDSSRIDRRLPYTQKARFDSNRPQPD